MFNDNSMLNLLVYDVDFPDGLVKQYVANVIDWNVPSQVDDNDYHTQFLDCIIMHERMGNAMDKKYTYITTKWGVMKL